MKAVILSAKVALAIGIGLAVLQAVGYVLVLPTWAHILISAVLGIAAIYHLVPAAPAQIASLLGPQVLAVIGVLAATFLAILPLIAVGSVWRAIIGGVVTLIGILLPGVVALPPPVPAAPAAGAGPTVGPVGSPSGGV